MNKCFCNVRICLAVAVVAGTLSAMTGCGQSAAHRAAFTLAQADAEIAATKSENDPWKIRNTLDSVAERLLATCQTNLWTGSQTCGELSEREMQSRVAPIQKESERYLLQAVKQMKPAAVRAAFERLEVKQPFLDLVPAVVDAADRAGGAPEDRHLFLVAGRLYGDGRYVVRDISRALGYFAEAWAAGEQHAAFESAALFKQINDTRNAYLWLLRCVGACQRSPYLRLQDLEAELSPEAIKQAQKAASDTSVVELDTKL